MANQLQNRLIGTIVLVALVVIFIPDLLDGQKERVEESFNSIPFAPERREVAPLVIELDANTQQLPDEAVVSVDIAKSATDTPNTPTKKTSAVDNSLEATAAQKSDVKSATATKAKAKPTSTPILDKPAYIIQLGAFKHAANVSRLVAQLREAGYQAHSFPAKPVDGEVNRVFVGPDIDAKKLSDKLDDLKKLTDLNGKVVRFDPLEQ